MPTRPPEDRATPSNDPQTRVQPSPPETAPGEVPEPESALEGLGKAITAPIRGAAEDEAPGPA